ncbi:MAG: hypothetical protein CBC29_05995 [Methylococcaceae bacterium TMED69]|nr:MAG: hypothetical protein CBC29_05995 [Methylococcaceae bacterium TMED69]|tara:strand:+ start:1704 stop:1943 length:240 start_codon:yes stop_codon:yes gene_type:complete
MEACNYNTGDLIEIVDFETCYMFCKQQGMVPIYPQDIYKSIGIISEVNSGGEVFEVLISNQLVYIEPGYIAPEQAFRRV